MVFNVDGINIFKYSTKLLNEYIKIKAIVGLEHKTCQVDVHDKNNIQSKIGIISFEPWTCLVDMYAKKMEYSKNMMEVVSPKSRTYMVTC